MATADLTSRLPREEQHVQKASQEWRLSVGEKTGNSTRNLRFWMLKKRHREQGGKATYLIDKEAQARLVEMAGEAQPKVLCCSVIGNPVADDLRPGKMTVPDSIVFREIAMFGNGRRLCYCQDPQAPKPMCHRAIQETVTRNGKTFKQITGYEDRPCTRDHPDKPCLAFNSDPPKCKPHIIVPLYLPWTGKSGAAVYRTTGWTAWGSMLDSLLQIAAMTNGWLHGLPLELVYEEHQLAAGPWVPAPRFRYNVTSAQKALTEANEMKALFEGEEEEEEEDGLPHIAGPSLHGMILAEVQKLRDLYQGGPAIQASQEEVAEAIASTLTDPVEQRETQEEFWPGVQDVEFEEVPPEEPGEPTAEEAARIKAEEEAQFAAEFPDKAGKQTRLEVEE